MKRPFGWADLTPEAKALLRNQPHKFERMELTDGPVAQGRLMAGPVIVSRQPDLFGTPDADDGDETLELFG